MTLNYTPSNYKCSQIFNVQTHPFFSNPKSKIVEENPFIFLTLNLNFLKEKISKN